MKKYKNPEQHNAVPGIFLFTFIPESAGVK